jgi:hypothetical protein
MTIEIFCCYARKDQSFLKHLKNLLTVNRNGSSPKKVSLLALDNTKEGIIRTGWHWREDPERRIDITNSRGRFSGEGLAYCSGRMEQALS